MKYSILVGSGTHGVVQSCWDEENRYKCRVGSNPTRSAISHPSWDGFFAFRTFTPSIDGYTAKEERQIIRIDASQEAGTKSIC